MQRLSMLGVFADVLTSLGGRFEPVKPTSDSPAKRHDPKHRAELRYNPRQKKRDRSLPGRQRRIARKAARRAAKANQKYILYP